MKNTVKIVIPIYKEYFGELEEKSFLQCVKILKNYDIVLVQPEGLDNSYITNKFSQIHAISFPKRYFENIEGYNELLLTSLFYETFLDTEYILIYQLDAFVYKDALKEWCQKGYDYIGAPWIATPENTFFLKYYNKLVRRFRSKKKNDREKIFFKVGNGGFSLRKTESHYLISKTKQEFIFDFLNSSNKELYTIEDVFWSIKAPEFDENFRIPDYEEALYFSIDRKPRIAFKLINNQMPFGCHGINKPKVVDFWRPILDRY